MASRRTALRSLLLALPLLLLAVSPVAAGDFRSSQSVTVADDETISDDLYAAAGTIDIAGTVEVSKNDVARIKKMLGR